MDEILIGIELSTASPDRYYFKKKLALFADKGFD